MNKRFCRKFLAPISAVLMSATMVKPVGAFYIPPLKSETRIFSDGVDKCIYFSDYLSGIANEIPGGWPMSLKDKFEYFLKIAREREYTHVQEHKVYLCWEQRNNRWRLYMKYRNGQNVLGTYKFKGDEFEKLVLVTVSPEEYAKLKLENASFDLIAPYTDELPEEIQSFYETANNIDKKIILSRMLAIGMVFLAGAGSAYGLSKLMDKSDKNLIGEPQDQTAESVSVIA